MKCNTPMLITFFFLKVHGFLRVYNGFLPFLMAKLRFYLDLFPCPETCARVNGNGFVAIPVV
jgi:hypothetical protein